MGSSSSSSSEDDRMAETPLLQQRRAESHLQARPSILSTLGEEIVRIVAPVSACMLLVVLLVTVLSDNFIDPPIPDLSSSSSSSSSSAWDNLETAIVTAVIFVAIVTALSFVLVLLFYFRFTRFLKYYMIFSSFVVLSLLGGQISVLLLSVYRVPLDLITFVILLFNFSIVGAAAVFRGDGGVPFVITQGYMVLIAVLVAYWFTFLPEWTSWALLVALALYDIAAVLLPGGPLRLLVELAMSRDEELPALVYEARPVNVDSDPHHRRLWRQVIANANSSLSEVGLASDNRQDLSSAFSTHQRRFLVPAGAADANSNSAPIPVTEEISLVINETSQSSPVLFSVSESPSCELTDPSLTDDGLVRTEILTDDCLEGSIGLGSSGAIKLGLGDFIFYSVLVGRVALYDFMGVYACYLAIIAGLGLTLLLLAFYQKALPALPFSIGLGVLFYILTRFLLEEFLVQCSVNLVMF